MSTQEHYFAADGNYGDARHLVVIDTTDWSTDDWGYVDSLSDFMRYRIAEEIMLGYGSLDQQDCPSCDFVGSVYRRFEYPAQGDSGGYTWHCPQCDTEQSYEGDDSYAADIGDFIDYEYDKYRERLVETDYESGEEKP